MTAISSKPQPHATGSEKGGASVQKRHRVRFGDTLERIANRHGVSTKDMLAANPAVKDPDKIRAGQTLRIPQSIGGGETFTISSTQPSGVVRKSLSADPSSSPPQTVQVGHADKMIDTVARVEGNARYDAWNRNDNGHGISFGLIQFNQKTGALPKLLKQMKSAQPQKFQEVFGPYADKMVDEKWVRGANLNDPDLKARLTTSARDPTWQKVQRDVARSEYLEPMASLAQKHGLKSELAVALMFDSAVQNGPTATRRMAARACHGGGGDAGFCERFARLADDNAHAGGRRTRLLASGAFSLQGPTELAHAVTTEPKRPTG
jgi:LysM repeat protein